MKGRCFGLLLFAVLSAGAERCFAEVRKVPVAIERSPSVTISKDPELGQIATVTSHGKGAAGRTAIASVQRTSSSSRLFGVTGLVRYDGVGAQGYLELINHLSTGGFFFSRGLAAVGPMRALQGSSDWRPFFLPADARGAEPFVTSVDLNLTLPAGGSVALAEVAIMNFGSEEEINSYMQELFSREQGSSSFPASGIIGGIFGVAGAAAGLLTALGRGRKVVAALLVTSVGAGVVLLATAVLQLVQGATFAAEFGNLLCGVLLTVIAGAYYRPTMKRFQDAEFRKMAAMDR